MPAYVAKRKLGVDNCQEVCEKEHLQPCLLVVGQNWELPVTPASKLPVAPERVATQLTPNNVSVGAPPPAELGRGNILPDWDWAEVLVRVKSTDMAGVCDPVLKAASVNEAN
mmetsp:Transcript_16800/g.42918  ORF Transcript_16800/g.42918 Transcript_16800/m.42918 type:complete len:112 (-) Transcript_16800:237-572(-)